ncbi:MULTISPECIES: SOS response-associated peptidase [Prochlorococcus]|uniref:Abasic site processing protein n=1 Tax=Prochlorococcus marinus (strain SARG / CCMP1375 / SS120) TaxID=167539 RepID=Q7VCT3_PROMA|nr:MULTISPECIES: SOS response-associated peptidase [Prochlorococcus]AAP99701.1 Uncharacterized conserved protein [Prochlorococcus marinus subsp. marinus str. CCMP1375]KGG13404.1 hypothetical protein EV04_0639 [Prochlorococcus marinus str. LG]KGG21352.1 hypothetical protein EV08_0760 [Prochlorococcus marinus str. SS2]KGG24316.1 hypothetical protein EV09_0363 [Prochlorococcus marinus str. SS35]KGG33600.1 hypothetical protein EV10_0440 [Prochlorococcus marinus str. SS51]
MCSRYELITKFDELPSLLKKDLPKGFEQKYAQQELIRPSDPVLALKNEGKITTSIMLWGFISEWAIDPFDKKRPRPFNARAESIGEKKLFRGSWRHKRCLMPASGFFEKGYRITRKNEEPFWFGGLWNKWTSPEGSELESCCVLTTEPNELVKPLHNRMPVIIPNGLEEEWLAIVKDRYELRALEKMLVGWSSEGWKAEALSKASTTQMSLF